MAKSGFNEQKEKEKLNKLINSLAVDKKTIAEGLIDDAAFMLEQLSKLKDHIRENGCTETYQNGANQHGIKQSSEFAAYIQLQKAYLSTMKQLIDLLPKESAIPAGEELMGFVTKP